MPVQQQTLSAQVILNAASGLSPSDSRITTENIDKFLPPKENIELAKKAFTKMGFDVGEFVGTSFSITAPAATFAKKFNLNLGVKRKTDLVKSIAGKHLALDKLPEDVLNMVHDIVFPERPDFGPGNF